MSAAAARMLRYARRRAGLTQRELAERAGVPQPTVSRIESRAVTPNFDTLERLLRVCGFSLEAQRASGDGVDATLIERLLAVSPEQRLESATGDAEALRHLLRSSDR